MKWTLEHTSRVEAQNICFTVTNGPKCSKYIPCLRTGCSSLKASIEMYESLQGFHEHVLDDRHTVFEICLH